MLPFPGEHTRWRGCPPSPQHTPSACSAWRVSQRCSDGSGGGREWGQSLRGGIKQPFPSMRDHRAPPALLEQAPVLPSGAGSLSPDKVLCHGAGWGSRCRQSLCLCYWPTALQTQMLLWFVPSCLASVAQSERRNSALKMKPTSENLDAGTRYDRVHCHLPPSICRVHSATTDWQDSLHHHLSPASAGSVTSTQQPAAEHGHLSFIFCSPRSQCSSPSRQGW